jgi:hypothetical protein
MKPMSKRPGQIRAGLSEKGGAADGQEGVGLMNEPNLIKV